ncbi:MAG: D-alanyl-D-alanine carboxypeptidase/D-alanyl-D-alanine-endopeptidase [Saprospiraceae bacterium]
MNRFLIVFLFGVLATTSIAQKSIENKVKKILSDSMFTYAQIGLSVRDIEGNESINIGGNKKMIPASSLKLITTLNALDILGKGFKYKTKIGYSGEIDDDGTLQGNIVIIGTGDPTLGSGRYGKENNWATRKSEIVDVIKQKGITCIDGIIEVRTNVYDGQSIGKNWPYSDIANYYGSGAWALNFNENKYNLYFETGKQGDIVSVSHTSPIVPNIGFTSEVVVKGAKTSDNAYIYGDPYNFNKIIRGSIPYRKQHFIIKGAIPNPPLTFAHIISDALTYINIQNGGYGISENPIKKRNFKELLLLTSRSLSTIIKDANFESINLYCESIIRLLGKKINNVGSIEGGVNIIKDRLIKIGIDQNSFHIEDGSGLSPRNTITTAAFTYFLSHIAAKRGVRDIIQYIPQTGASGTVSSMLKGENAQKNFYLKSGSMGGVLSYTGYFRSQGGKWYSFSIIINNHAVSNTKIRRKIEEVCEIIYLQLP